jgi:hypothetical protein
VEEAVFRLFRVKLPIADVLSRALAVLDHINIHLRSIKTTTLLRFWSSRQMASPVPVPHDIICSVLEMVPQDDTNTLKQCSVVSRSFLTPCQRKLFSITYLSLFKGSLSRLRHLYGLLFSRRYIASYIRELHVIDCELCKTWDPGSKQPEAEILRHLLLILTPHLRVFSLALNYGSLLTMPWSHFPSNLQSALLKLFKSPNMTSIKVTNLCVDTFPADIFSGLKQLKKLGFVSCYHRNHSSDFPLASLCASDSRGANTQLESLGVGGNISPHVITYLTDDNSLAVSHLKEFCIHDAQLGGMPQSVLSILLEVFQAAASTLESFVWSYRIFSTSDLFPYSHFPSSWHNYSQPAMQFLRLDSST